MHVLDIPKLKQERADPDSSVRDLILKEESYTMSYMLQSIELREKNDTTSTDHTVLEALMNLKLEKGEKLSSEKEEGFLNILESPNVGKTITNLSEYLLLTQGMKGDIDVSYQLF